MPYIAGLPMPHAFAPSASALTTSLPRRMPPSSQTSSFDRRPASVSMEMISGSASIDESIRHEPLARISTCECMLTWR